MTSREGIEIDYCPQCRGVWLDRGELDKLIERGNAGSAHVSVNPQPQQNSYDRREEYRGRERHEYPDGHHRKKRKESFLGDLFDF